MFSPNVDTPVTDEANNVVEGGIHIFKDVPIGKMIQMVYHIKSALEQIKDFLCQAALEQIGLDSTH